MNIENIVFEKDDSKQQLLTKIVQINAGSHRLKVELTKLGVNYVKVCKGASTVFILRGKGIERLTVKL